MEKAILGLDIGGTGIKGGILIKGHLEDIRSIPTPALESKEFVLETIASFIETYLHYDFVGIGIGIPGLVDTQEGIVLGLANIPSFQHVELKKFLTTRFLKPVFVNNDANCFAIGVHKYGVGKPFKTLWASLWEPAPAGNCHQWTPLFRTLLCCWRMVQCTLSRPQL